jgi:hypothetical protein
MVHEYFFNFHRLIRNVSINLRHGSTTTSGRTRSTNDRAPMLSASIAASMYSAS